MKNIKTYEQYREVSFEDFLKSNPKSIEIEIIGCSVHNLIDLDGIEYYTQVEGLWCYKNKITSLKPLENLTRLKNISCWGNNITSLEPLKNLINLESLDCNDNKITSLKGIENLNNLLNLYCKYNPIDWIDYIDKKGNTWYIELPKSIDYLESDKFKTINDYWKFMDKNQPASISRKFNF